MYQPIFSRITHELRTYIEGTSLVIEGEGLEFPSILFRNKFQSASAIIETGIAKIRLRCRPPKKSKEWTCPAATVAVYADPGERTFLDWRITPAGRVAPEIELSIGIAPDSFYYQTINFTSWVPCDGGVMYHDYVRHLNLCPRIHSLLEVARASAL